MFKLLNANTRTVSRIYLTLLAFFVTIGFLTRIILLFDSLTVVDFGFGDWCAIFLLGIVNDACVFTMSFVFMLAFLLSIARWKFIKPWNFICIALLLALIAYLSFCNTIFDEYGAGASKGAIGVVAFWLLSFCIRNFVPRARKLWTMTWFWVIATIYVGATYFNVISEVAFWHEFGVRYNFIAVDYLIYTHEVIGNIFESYPMFAILSIWFLCSVATTWFLFRKNVHKIGMLSDKGQWKWTCTAAYVVLFLVSMFVLGFTVKFQDTTNTFVNELQANGLHKFWDAFQKNKLTYSEFYITISPDEATRQLERLYPGGLPDGRMTDNVPDSVMPQRPNIILISMESLSADYLERFGNKSHLTPTLDSLYNRSLAFDNIFAAGNRTVRGLEALTLSLPPCPGQSIVKQPDNKNLFSLGSVLRDNGYSTTYFYGGDAYFDNMEEFFGGNGYNVMDRKKYSPDQITFANIWGVCDEDSYNKLLTTLDTMDIDDRPFFAHLMTVSNHRPFTYPAGKISIPNNVKSRKGGVMYSDYALGQFLEQASQKEWFDNTVFIITADHCASSAGATEIPLGKYHIPAIVYAPALIQPKLVSKVASQIDIIPTALALMGINYPNHFYGTNILSDDYKSKAFIATYQDLGYLEDDVLTVLSPVKRVMQFRWTPTEDDLYHLELMERLDADKVKTAIAFYQTGVPTHLH